MFIQVVGQEKQSGDENRQQYAEDTEGDLERFHSLVFMATIRLSRLSLANC